jgi:hypothetical protein
VGVRNFDLLRSALLATSSKQHYNIRTVELVKNRR